MNSKMTLEVWPEKKKTQRDEIGVLLLAGFLSCPICAQQDCTTITISMPFVSMLITNKIHKWPKYSSIIYSCFNSCPVGCFKTQYALSTPFLTLGQPNLVLPGSHTGSGTKMATAASCGICRSSQGLLEERNMLARGRNMLYGTFVTPRHSTEPAPMALTGLGP